MEEEEDRRMFKGREGRFIIYQFMQRKAPCLIRRRFTISRSSQVDKLQTIMLNCYFSLVLQNPLITATNKR